MKQIIREIEKNARERIRVELDTFNGRQVFAARVWYVDAKTGELKPTPKGLTADIKHLSAIRAALADAEDLARASGLIT